MGGDLEFEEVRILRLQPGDEIIVRVARQRAEPENLEQVRRLAEERWPNNRVTVLSGDVDIEIVRQDG